MTTVFERLYAASDTKYKEFQAKLVPNISSDTIIGVRTPAMRKIAKEIYKSGEYEEFLDALPHKWYEENLVHFFVIALIGDFDECIKRTEQFLPYVDCWPVSDQSSPKAFKKKKDKLMPYIKKWIASEHVYTARFGIRILMNEFLGDDFRIEYAQTVAAKTENATGIPKEASDDYYLRMMVAWYFATALAKNYDETVVFMEEGKMDDWSRRKSIRKAIESFRVTDEHKKYLRSLM